ncbi:MAG: NAD(+) diphosphatase [Gammaproteobacteria bacterium]|nr:NAD(+) diphosphatase [Gammaproteobacteria bacterium]
MSQYLNPNVFAVAGLDRQSVRRENDQWISSQWESERMRWIPLCGKHQLVTDAPEVRLLDRAAREALDGQLRHYFFLGVSNGVPLFGVEIEESARGSLESHGEWRDLRGIATLLPANQANWLAQAQALRHWHETHHYCGHCGQPTESIAAGHARVCVNESCDTRNVFPRMDPAIIVLVHDEDRCLLGRQASWDKGRYSCIAGFVEAGESLEQAVIREVAEETGVQAVNPQYHSSQPWPFPQSLMLGFTAQALGKEIRLHDKELEDARWFTREGIREGLQDGSLKLPSSLSISHRLLTDWFAETDEDLELLREAERG